MTTSASQAYRLAVILPCYNEEAAITAVVRDFREALPEAVIYVYDNNSRDRTVELARAAGAVVRRETRQGKGHVPKALQASQGDERDGVPYVQAVGGGIEAVVNGDLFFGQQFRHAFDKVEDQSAPFKFIECVVCHTLFSRVETGLV